jgi:hypothetical protein
MFCFLLPPVNFNDVTQALKSMERKSNRQNDGQYWTRQMPSQQPGETDKASSEKIEIFENEKYRAGREDTYPQ